MFLYIMHCLWFFHLVHNHFMKINDWENFRGMRGLCGSRGGGIVCKNTAFLMENPLICIVVHCFNLIFVHFIQIQFMKINMINVWEYWGPGGGSGPPRGGANNTKSI